MNHRPKVLTANRKKCGTAATRFSAARLKLVAVPEYRSTSSTSNEKPFQPSLVVFAAEIVSHAMDASMFANGLVALVRKIGSELPRGASRAS